MIVGSEVLKFRGSRFEGSEVQGLRVQGSEVQGLRVQKPVARS